MTCPYHLGLLSLNFIPNRSTLTVLLMYSFLILSFLVTPIANLNIFISATSISSTCFFMIATVSSPYTIVNLTTELYTFPFTLAGNLLSQITPDTLPHPFHPACTLFFTSLSQLPLSCTVDPKYNLYKKQIILTWHQIYNKLYFYKFDARLTNINRSTFKVNLFLKWSFANFGIKF